MATRLLTFGQVIVAPWWARLQGWVDGLLVQATEAMPPEAAAPEKKGFPTWAIILIIAVVILCLLPICVIVILALLGPAVGNVFSNVIEGI